MQSRSSTYQTIFADAGHTVEWKVTVNGTDYGGDKLIFSAGGGNSAPKLSRSMFTGSQPEVGKCVAATFSCAIIEASSAIPRMATVVPAYRLVLGSSVSEWITLGTFYIDTRQVDKATGALLLTCYDKMLVADGAGGASYADLTGFDEWPQSQSAVVSEIASIMGITVDSRTSIGSGEGYMVEYPNDLSMREVLGYIGVANAGNWTITPANTLRLVPLTGGSGTFNLGASVTGLKTAPAFASWTGVTVYWDDEEAYEAGADTGRVLTCDCPWAKQATANGILAALSGSSYQPYTSEGAIIDLALELGDIVTVGLTGDQVIGPVFSIDITGGALEQASISAPGEDEIDHEYPYESYVDRSLKRRVTLGQAYEGVTISRKFGIQILGINEQGDKTNRALLNSHEFTMDVKTDGGWEQQFYFDPERRAYVFKGALGADAIYADMGDIAELTVDRLSTSKKVRLYNLQNTGDDNFVHIQDNYIRLTTGSVKYDPNDPTTPLTEQATNRWGDPLYWQAIPDHINASGYPVDADGRQIYATTETPTPGEGETLDDYKVMVYQYTEQIKSSLAFQNEAGTYIPVLTMGAGDNNGYSKGYLYKETTDLLLQYINSQGDDVSVMLGDDGFVDINKLRRATVMNFSSFDLGFFTETLEGDVLCSYSVEFDNDGNPIRIYDDTHSCDIVW